MATSDGNVDDSHIKSFSGCPYLERIILDYYRKTGSSPVRESPASILIGYAAGLSHEGKIDKVRDEIAHVLTSAEAESLDIVNAAEYILCSPKEKLDQWRQRKLDLGDALKVFLTRQAPSRIGFVPLLALQVSEFSLVDSTAKYYTHFRTHSNPSTEIPFTTFFINYLELLVAAFAVAPARIAGLASTDVSDFLVSRKGRLLSSLTYRKALGSFIGYVSVLFSNDRLNRSSAEALLDHIPRKGEYPSDMSFRAQIAALVDLHKKEEIGEFFSSVFRS